MRRWKKLGVAPYNLLVNSLFNLGGNMQKIVYIPNGFKIKEIVFIPSKDVLDEIKWS